jgi:hypothetical protein
VNALFARHLQSREFRPLPIPIAHRPEAALNPHADAPAIRAVAAQVRRQVPRDSDSLALTLPALIDACRCVAAVPGVPTRRRRVGTPIALVDLIRDGLVQGGV